MDTATKIEFRLGFLHPRYWPTWLMLGLWWLSAQLPYRLLVRIGKIVGKLTYRMASRRRHICRRNIDLCFPELSDDEREQLTRENFEATAIALFETGMVWFAPHWRLRRLIRVEGVDALHALQAQGSGCVLLIMHFVTLEVLGYAFNSRVDGIDMTYRPHRNPVFDWAQRHGRDRHNASSDVVPAGDVKGMVRALRRGRFLSYFPDQDYGRKHSVFAPFFGIPTATVTALSRLAKMAKVPVVPLVCRRLDNGRGFAAKVLPPLAAFPSGDDMADATQVNALVEACIREQAEQYLWMHRRFKTRPPGEVDLYGLPKKHRRRGARGPGMA